MSSQIDDDFINAGVRHFGDAGAAVTGFREQVRACVDDALRAPASSVCTVRPAKDIKDIKDIKATKSQPASLWCGTGGRPKFTDARIGEVNVDVGLRWNWPAQPSAPACLCAVFVQGPDWLLNSATLRDDSDIKLVWDRKKANYVLIRHVVAPDL